MITTHLTRFLASAFLLCAVSSANETTGDRTAGQDVAIMQEALALRRDMAGAVAQGSEKPEAALDRLRKASFPSGLKISAEAGFAYAAIDLGHRLVLRNPAEAELFFRAAEAALDEEVKRTADDAAKDKAQHLQSLAMIRGNYLNKAEQAQADVAAAVKLQPGDKYLAQFQKTLSARTTKPEQALVIKEGSK